MKDVHSLMKFKSSLNVEKTLEVEGAGALGRVGGSVSARTGALGAGGVVLGRGAHAFTRGGGAGMNPSRGEGLGLEVG